jgi:chromate transport protein ChrA
VGSPNRDGHFPHCFVDDTYIGYQVRGIWGTLTAAVAFVLPAFIALILVLLIPYHDRLRGVEKVRMMEQGVLGSFIGMLGLVLYNFGRASLVDIPKILMAAAVFFAIYKKISLPYILVAGGILSILIYGFLF